MTLREAPPLWNSVHRPIEFVYDYDEYFIAGYVNAVTDDVATLSIPGGISGAAAGDRIRLTGMLGDGEELDGTYEILTADTTNITFTLEGVTTLSNDGVAYLIYAEPPEIKLYSGYASGEEYPTDLPLTLVATFTPENSPDNDIQFDVSEYLKSIFTISPPVEGIDFNMFNRFRLHFDGVYHEQYQVLNSSIKTSELNELYVDTGAYLNSQVPPIVFGCGKTLLSTLTGNVVQTELYEDADIPTHGDYNSDFSNDYHNE